MENWEFLLQRKGDKSWLPLESPTVEILEGQYRLAARSALSNTLVGIAIAYRPLADVRHQPLQQKIAKRISHDGLLIVMPYTNFPPGLWQIDCVAADSESDSGGENEVSAWKKTVKFDVIPVSQDSGADWQYSNDLEEEDLETPTEIADDVHTNALGIVQTEPTPLSYSSPILDIAEQRSTELVQSMFEEFALFNDELDEEENTDDQDSNQDLLSDSPVLEKLELEKLERPSVAEPVEINAPLQPRILLRLQQPQYIVNEDNSFNLTGDVYIKGEIEVSLKDPQTLDVVFNQRYPITNTNDQNKQTGAIPFALQILVPPPSEIQVLIGEVQIHPHPDFSQDSDVFVTQQAIAVSYPASRVLPELIKEAQNYSPQDNSLHSSPTNQESISDSSYSQFPQSFPQVAPPREQRSPSPSTNVKPTSPLSLPPLPSNKTKARQGEQLEQKRSNSSLSLPPLPTLKNKVSNQDFEDPAPTISEDYPQSFPQADFNDLPHETLQTDDDLQRIEIDREIPVLETTEDEPELLYSFEEELPQNYEELLEQPLNRQQPASRDRNNRFLSKLQTLSAEAIASQKANQRTEELLLDKFVPSDPLVNQTLTNQDLTDASIDLDKPNDLPRTIAEVTSLAELDHELDIEFDRLLAPEDNLILNEYVWEDPIDPNTFPVNTTSSSVASTLSETAQAIRNLQEASPQALSDQEPIPIPEIIISEGEIISGTPMLITVRLPASVPKFFVKFWIKDLQTRIIVDGPRWLLDFSAVPNTNFIETRTNISIPLSSIDVAFEAIAIEAQTQRESHKVRIIRSVAPPNL